MYEEIIKRCPLFSGLSGSGLSAALKFFDARQKSYPSGQILNRPGEPLGSFGLVLSGSVQVFMEDIDGNRILMAGVEPGGTFGESLCFLNRDADIIISCVGDTVLLVMKTDGLYGKGNTDPGCAELSRRFCAMLAAKTLSMNNRIQVLSKTGIREKVITLLSDYSPRNGNEIELPFDRNSLALYLGVNRSALSRELGKMRDEGIIDFRKNKFIIK